MSFHIPSYSDIYNLGHRALEGFFNDAIEVTSKIDGSQISFCKMNGEYFARSKGQDIILDNPEKLFIKGVESIKTLDLKDGWIYRGEYLSKNKHNTLNYNRIPNKHIILFNIDKGDQNYLTYEEMVIEGNRIGLEVVPLLFRGKINDINQLKELLDKESYLGGCKEEGLVCKNYNMFGRDKKTLMCKLVNDDFKEVHSQEWRKNNPTKTDIIDSLILEYKVSARFQKAYQHLNEKGLITDELKDIGALMKETELDILKEEEQNIKDKLFKHFWPHIKRGVVSGIPNWYKEKLAKIN